MVSTMAYNFNPQIWLSLEKTGAFQLFFSKPKIQHSLKPHKHSLYPTLAFGIKADKSEELLFTIFFNHFDKKRIQIFNINLSEKMAFEVNTRKSQTEC